MIPVFISCKDNNYMPQLRRLKTNLCKTKHKHPSVGDADAHEVSPTSTSTTSTSTPTSTSWPRWAITPTRPVTAPRRTLRGNTPPSEQSYGIRGMGEEIVCKQPEMEMCGNGEDVDYCLDFSDIVGEEATDQEDDSVGASEADVEHDDPTVLKLGFSNFKQEAPEFCVMDGFKLYKGCREELPREGSKHGASLLRLDYNDVLSSWCDDRSLWTDGKRPQTVPEQFSFTNAGPSVNDYGLVPELRPCSPAITTHGGEDEGRGARVSRYREKKRSRLFSKKIRYEVRKVNAESRPRMKVRSTKPPKATLVVLAVFTLPMALTLSLSVTKLQVLSTHAVKPIIHGIRNTWSSHRKSFVQHCQRNKHNLL